MCKEKLQDLDFHQLTQDYKSILQMMYESKESVPEMIDKLKRASDVLDNLGVPIENEENEELSTPMKYNGPMEYEDMKTPRVLLTPKTARTQFLSQFLSQTDSNDSYSR